MCTHTNRPPGGVFGVFGVFLRTSGVLRPQDPFRAALKSGTGAVFNAVCGGFCGDSGTYLAMATIRRNITLMSTRTRRHEGFRGSVQVAGPS